MLNSTAAYQAAVTGDTRRVLVRVVVDIVDPDIAFGAVESSGAAPVCDPAQLHNQVYGLAPYATLEPNRWVLNGQFRIFPDTPAALTGEAGFLGAVRSGADGSFSPPAWVEAAFSNVTLLQACSLYFPTADWDGVPEDFTVEIKQGGTAYYRRAVTGNQESQVDLSGFSVQNPDAIRLTVTRWSLPGRRLRAAEIVPGVHEVWDNSDLSALDVTQQASFSCLSLPYGTCNLSMDNQDRRFEPRNKDGIFRSIEERQGLDVSIGVALPDGSAEYKRVGVFYQYSGGWKTGDNGLAMQWDLVDIIGLLSDRQYLPPQTLPTTLEGWVSSLVGQLGDNFAGRYAVDAGVAETPVTANAAADVSGKSCGEILRMACMAAGAFPRAESGTGYLAVSPLWEGGGTVNLDNLTEYPVMKANDDLAALIFTLYDGTEGGTQLVVSGTATSSSKTVAVQNPFLHTREQALTAARLILSTYGGNQLETTGRGDPAGEIGDVDTVWLDRSAATAGRRMQQSFHFSGGVMQGCTSVFLQAGGALLFEERAVLTASGSWTAPAGVTRLRLVLVGGGDGGAGGTDGDWGSAGTDGADGQGGLVWTGTVDINPQQTFAVTIGAGGGVGLPGGATVFGAYASANGQRYDPNYVDVASGEAYARDGVPSPLDHTGDGGKGGAGGAQGNRHMEQSYDAEGNPSGSHYVVDNAPGEGTPGTPGASGVAVVYWDKEEAQA